MCIRDSINDTGRTLGELKSIIANMEADDVHIGDIRYAVLLEKYSSQHEFDFVGDHIYEDEDATWVVFPWEDWWNRAWKTGSSNPLITLKKKYFKINDLQIPYHFVGFLLVLLDF